MDLFNLGGRAFRARLKRELPRWREEGLVEEAAAATLEERYQLGEEGLSAAAAAIYALGVLLIGGGIISLVAWNWERMPKAAKLSLMGTSMVAAHLIGFWLWRIRRVLPKLGHALTLLGTLIFGANIGLLAQIYNIHADPAAGFGAWALGATVAAWALASAPNGTLAVLLAAIWASIHLAQNDTLHGLLPWLVLVPFLPLALWRGSRLLFAALCLGLLWAAAWSAGSATEHGAAVFVALFGVTALLLVFPSGAAEDSPRGRFRGVALLLGMLAFVTLAFLCSFHELAEEVALDCLRGRPLGWLWFTAPVAGLALLGGLFFARDLGRRPVLFVAWSGCFLLPVALALDVTGTLAAVVANLALACVAVLAVATAVRTLERLPFWTGSVLGGVVILSRFFEFETELWLKGLVFLACGIVLVTVGVLFERRRKEEGAVGHG